MTGHQECPFKLAGEPLFKPDDRFHIEMVCWLIKQQHVRFQGQDTCQGNAHLPTAAERFDRVVIAIRADSETGQNSLST